jgi:peptidoglycan/LPS O-acetylase OafA/YrhL
MEAAGLGSGPVRFPLFDSVRAIAALLILVVHAAAQGGALQPGKEVGPYVGNLIVGVPIFFLISGFLLYRPFAVAHLTGAPPPDTGAYGWRRLLRIVPAYWIALIGAALMLGLHGVLTLPRGLSYFGFAQIYDSDTLRGGMPQAWTLDVEVTFYAFLPAYAWLLARVLRRGRDWLRVQLAGLAALVVLATAYRLAFVGPTSPGDRFPIALGFLPGFLDHFALGMGLAVLSIWIAERGRLPRVLRPLERFPVIAWIGALAAFLVLPRLGMALGRIPVTRTQVFESHWLYAAVALGILLPAVVGDPRHGLVRRLLSTRALLYLGTISYGIYLWNPTVVRWAGERGLDFGTGGSAYIAWCFAGLALTVAVAAPSWHSIEQPLLRLKRLVPDRSRPSAVDAQAAQGPAGVSPRPLPGGS